MLCQPSPMVSSATLNKAGAGWAQMERATDHPSTNQKLLRLSHSGWPRTANVRSPVKCVAEFTRNVACDKNLQGTTTESPTPHACKELHRHECARGLACFTANSPVTSHTRARTHHVDIQKPQNHPCAPP